jgi:hypothetical protein
MIVYQHCVFSVCHIAFRLSSRFTDHFNALKRSELKLKRCLYRPLNKPRAITYRYPPSKQTNRLPAQSKIHQNARVSLPWPTSPLAFASVRHSLSRFSRPKHPTMKSILSKRLMPSNCSSVISPDESTYSSQRPKLLAIYAYVGELI